MKTLKEQTVDIIEEILTQFGRYMWNNGNEECWGQYRAISIGYSDDGIPHSVNLELYGRTHAGFCFSSELIGRIANLVHQIDKSSTKGAKSDTPKDGVGTSQKTESVDTITFEFPAIKTNGTYFDLGLRRAVDAPVYSMTFKKIDIEYIVMSDNWQEYLSWAEFWIIKKYYNI